MENISEDMASGLFLSGARSVAEERGMSASDADAFAAHVMKQAASRRVRLDDDEDDDTWWSRNKHWALPVLVGAGALWAGNDAGKNGRADRNVFQNLKALWSERLGALLGVPKDPTYRSLTDTR